ncbi:methyltransferase domain-containing protein [Litoribacillus peritrichatus]|uniref:Methyltransferase type 11 domain-containing protein n=1 Tax=Litoribacillus peritrichatus TaxID=718191 RepID=A0ABP7NE29_9GAMM
MNGFIFLAGMTVGVVAVFVIQTFRMKRFDLSDEILNLSPAKHHWGNLGYWENTQDYQTACQQLAVKVADAAGLNNESELIDIGFGTGEQLLLWHQRYQVKHITGVNTSQAQVGLAQQKIKHHNVSAFLHHFDHSAVNTQPDRSFTHLLSVDAAYFFNDKEQWFKQNLRILKPEGAMVVTDMVMPQQPSDLLQEFIMRLALWLCGIPKENVITLDDYQKQLAEAGFSQVETEDLSEFVMDGFAHWLPTYQASFAGLKDAPIWHKYTGTARLLSWLRKHDLLRYYLIKAKR